MQTANTVVMTVNQ